MTWSISIVEKYEMCCRLHFAKILFSEDFYMKKWNVVSIKGDDFILYDNMADYTQIYLLPLNLMYHLCCDK